MLVCGWHIYYIYMYVVGIKIYSKGVYIHIYIYSCRFIYILLKYSIFILTDIKMKNLWPQQQHAHHVVVVRACRLRAAIAPHRRSRCDLRASSCAAHAVCVQLRAGTSSRARASARVRAHAAHTTQPAQTTAHERDRRSRAPRRAASPFAPRFMRSGSAPRAVCVLCLCCNSLPRPLHMCVSMPCLTL